MIYIFDLDKTICSETNGEYEKAKPFKNRIREINKLGKKHTIIIYTGRGLKTKSMALTKRQLKKWGLKYRRLIFKKPYYDEWIDDKATNSEDFFNKKCKIKTNGK
jgi:hypothetical protein